MEIALSVISERTYVSRSIYGAAVMALFIACGFSADGQTQPAPSVQPLSPTSASLRDPTRPEVQPRLDVDHDPIPSPDLEVSAPSGNAASPNGAEQPGGIQKRQDGVYTMHQDVDEVLLTCAVVDEKGRPVQDLRRGDFRVWEDGVLQTQTSFLHQDQPVSLGIVVDNSGSMLDKRAAVKEAALNMLRASNSHDSTFIVNFADRAFLDQRFTSDIDALNRGLSHFDSRGTTAMYDAVAASADELARGGKLQRKVLLVITDGADNASHLDLEQAIRRVQDLGGPVVYTIGLLFDANKAEAQHARSALEKLSAETGGIAYFPEALEDVNTIASEVALDIRDQYIIGYRSSKSATIEGYRTLRVEASAPKHGKLTVRTRKGYFAKKPAREGAQTAQTIPQ